MSDVPVRLAGVAEMIGRSPKWTSRHLRKLQEDHGFPKPLPLINRYDPNAVRAWIARQDKVDTSGEPDWAAILDGRASSLAAPGTGGRC